MLFFRSAFKMSKIIFKFSSKFVFFSPKIMKNIFSNFFNKFLSWFYLHAEFCFANFHGVKPKDEFSERKQSVGRVWLYKLSAKYRICDYGVEFARATLCFFCLKNKLIVINKSPAGRNNLLIQLSPLDLSRFQKILFIEKFLVKKLASMYINFELIYQFYLVSLIFPQF